MPPDSAQRPSTPSLRGPSGGVPRFLGAGDFVYRSQPVPVFQDAHGTRLRDADGRTYIDAEGANGTTALGYDPTLLQEAMERVARLPALPSFCESSLRLEVAERLERHVARSTGCDGRVTFEVGGAQGIELAMKIVAANVGWGQVVVFQGGYHGRSPFTTHLSVSPRYRAQLGGSVGEVIRLPYPDRDRSPFGLGPEDAAMAARAYVESFGTERSGIRAGDVAALVFEPILNVGGMARPDPAFIHATVAHFRSLGALVVVDEVFTGFHRTGPAHGFELYGIDPDVVVLSKALTNGAAALSAIWAREPLLDEAHFAPGAHSSTLSGTPLSLAIAGCSVDVAPAPNVGASALIMDQLHNGGTEGFVFLPPMVPRPASIGEPG